MAVKRIKLSDVRSDVRNAFLVMKGNGPAFGLYQEAYRRLIAFLDQVEADQELSRGSGGKS